MPSHAHTSSAPPSAAAARSCASCSGATGVAGRPEEFFEFLNATGRPRQPREYFHGVEDPTLLDLLPPLLVPLPKPSWERQVEDAVERGTTDNGVFGAKMMWAYLGDFLAHGSEPGGAVRRPALGPRQPRRHARAGDLAVAGDPDQPVAGRGPRRLQRRARLPPGRDRPPQAAPRGARGRVGRLVRRARDRAPRGHLRGPRRRRARHGPRRARAPRAADRRDDPRPAAAPPGGRALARMGGALRRGAGRRLAPARRGAPPTAARRRSRGSRSCRRSRRRPSTSCARSRPSWSARCCCSPAARTRSCCCGWPRRRSAPARCRSRSCTSTPGTTSPR